MEILRTPDERFENLPGYPFVPHYADVDGLRIHYVDEGAGAPVLLLHGEPSWSYLYRTMIPILAEAGHRVIAPDLVGFGRSDKPARIEDYSYARHVGWITGFIETLDLRGVTVFGQDWGGLIGLRVAVENDDRFARIVAGNTGLPTGDVKMADVWYAFKEHVRTTPDLHIAGLVASGCKHKMSDEIKAAYDAPFPSDEFKAGARAFPGLVPISTDDPAREANLAAWKKLEAWTKPFLTLFADSDPITRGGDLLFQARVPGCAGQPHRTIEDAGHFLQEDQGEAVARAMVDWLG